MLVGLTLAWEPMENICSTLCKYGEEKLNINFSETRGSHVKPKLPCLPSCEMSGLKIGASCLHNAATWGSFEVYVLCMSHAGLIDSVCVVQLLDNLSWEGEVADK
jgi:hypothetical protein